MHPLISQALAAERTKDMRDRAAAARLAAAARPGQRHARHGMLAAAIQTLRRSGARALARYRPAPAWKPRPSR